MLAVLTPSARYGSRVSGSRPLPRRSTSCPTGFQFSGRAPAPTPKQVTTVVATPRSASTPRQQGTRRLGKAFLDAGTAACYCVSAASRSHNVQCSGGMAPAPPARSARRNGGIQMAQRIGITERAGVLHIFTAVAAAGYRQALTWLRPDVAAGVLHAERAAGGRY